MNTDDDFDLTKRERSQRRLKQGAIYVVVIGSGIVFVIGMAAYVIWRYWL